ncbi:MAG: biopolymer transporter ExbD [Pseudomonadota bacterium]
MDFSEPRATRPSEPFVPMINVVFLLLIFFLMTAQIAPPEPFDLSPPKTEAGGDPVGQTVLFLSPDGEFGFMEQRGGEAIDAAMAVAAEGSLKLRVDGGMEARVLAARLKQLTEAGALSVELLTAPR